MKNLDQRLLKNNNERDKQQNIKVCGSLGLL